MIQLEKGDGKTHASPSGQTVAAFGCVQPQVPWNRYHLMTQMIREKVARESKEKKGDSERKREKEK